MDEHFIISRTDAIGDVILSLHLARALKEKYPSSKITWFGKTYTQAIIKACKYVDDFLNYDEWIKLTNSEKVEQLKSMNASTIIHVFPRKEIARAAKDAKIPTRIGTSHRIFHILTCNKLLNLGRKNSDLHESQLNFRLLAPLGIEVPDLSFLKHQPPILSSHSELAPYLGSLLHPTKKNIILHPKSQGSAREWGLENFKTLIQLLPANEFQFFISGTSKEAELMKDFLNDLPNNVTDVTGKFTLEELIAFIGICNGLVAASTGPLHIAASLGINALGIFPPIRPMHPGRWAPIGQKASYLCASDPCVKCKTNPTTCSCMALVSPMMVAEQLLSWK
jgi:ADP-heptose:LPS heptosyltransferase